METKRWRRLVARNDWYHFARFPFLPTRKSALHTHDFPEIFWIERGSGRHSIGGDDRRLRAGDLVCVRASDQHCLRAADEAGFVLVNLAFAPGMLEELTSRYPARARRLFSGKPRLPVRVELSARQQAALDGLLPVLEHGGRRKVALDAFLTGLLALLEPTRDETAGLDGWLATACERVHDPLYFAEGANGLVRAAGRSAAHVARTVRAKLGCTPSDYVNRVRMDFAARELRLGTRPIVEIALECGINDLSHFYALFKASHRITPRAYRSQFQRHIV